MFQDLFYQHRAGRLRQPELTVQPPSYSDEVTSLLHELSLLSVQGSRAGLQGLTQGCTALLSLLLCRGKPEKALDLGIAMLH